MQFLKLTGNLERAIHGAGENAKMSGTRELLLLDGYIKVGHIFSVFSSQLLRNEMAHADYENAVLSGQQKQRNARLGFREAATGHFHFRNIKRENMSLYQILWELNSFPM